MGTVKIIEEVFKLKFIDHFRPELFSKRSGLIIEDILSVFSFPSVDKSLNYIYEKGSIDETVNDINVDAFIFFVTLLYTYMIRKAPYIPDKELVEITIIGHEKLKENNLDSIRVKYVFQ